MYIPVVVFFALISLPLYCERVYAQQDTHTSALEIIATTADKICGSLQEGDNQLAPDTNLMVRSQLKDLNIKLAQIGPSKAAISDTEQYAGVIKDQLAAAIVNNAQCKLEVFQTLVAAINPEAKPAATISVTRESGWRGGGYNQDAWCNDLIAILKGEHNKADFIVTAKSEVHESRCRPFNCPQYKYTCTVQITE